MRAEISICHKQIKSCKNILDEPKQQLSSLDTDDTSSAFSSKSKGMQRCFQALAKNPRTISLRYLTLSTKKAGPVPFSRKNRSLPGLHQRFQPRILFVRLRQLSSDYPEDTKDTIQTTTASSSTEPVFPCTLNSPKKKRILIQ